MSEVEARKQIQEESPEEHPTVSAQISRGQPTFQSRSDVNSFCGWLLWATRAVALKLAKYFLHLGQTEVEQANTLQKKCSDWTNIISPEGFILNPQPKKIPGFRFVGLLVKLRQ